MVARAGDDSDRDNNKSGFWEKMQTHHAFGRAQFGTYLGRLALPQGIVSASAPPILAATMASYGASGVLVLTFIVAMIALITTIMLVRVSGPIR